jgi:hypothetical protein
MTRRDTTNHERAASSDAGCGSVYPTGDPGDDVTRDPATLDAETINGATFDAETFDAEAESRRRWRRADGWRWGLSLAAIAAAGAGAAGAQAAGLEVTRPLPWFGIAAVVLVGGVAAWVVERARKVPGETFSAAGGSGTGVLRRRDLGRLVVGETVRFEYRDGRVVELSRLQLVVVARTLGGTGLDAWDGRELIGSWMLGALPHRVREALARRADREN